MNTIEFLRQFRIGEYAIFDFAASFLGIYLIAPLLSKLFLKLRLDIPKHNWLLLALPISILIHLLFGNITPMTANFISINGHYLLKALIILLLAAGIRGIKVVKKK